MKSDSFAQFSMTRLWLLVRREVLVMTFGDYFIIFLMPFLTISIFISPTLYASNTLKDDFSLFMLLFFRQLFIFPIMALYIKGNTPTHLRFYQPFPQRNDSCPNNGKIYRRIYLFRHFVPFGYTIFYILSFLIFRVDFSIWFNSAVGFFAFCSPLIAFRFLRIAIVENTSLRRYHDAVPYLGEIIEFIFLMGTMFGFIIFYEDVLPLNNLAAITAAAITVILWWATYRIRLKNAKR